MMISEALRLAGVLVTVFHLFIMVSIHLGGVMYPVKFAEVRRILDLVYKV